MDLEKNAEQKVLLVNNRTSGLDELYGQLPLHEGNRVLLPLVHCRVFPSIFPPVPNFAPV